jgi:hypothetical protein
MWQEGEKRKTSQKERDHYEDQDIWVDNIKMGFV